MGLLYSFALWWGVSALDAEMKTTPMKVIIAELMVVTMVLASSANLIRSPTSS
ncbi:hypothetical protein ACFRQM_13560 [Streptomyces sp. NPDC056831]|uniref:hypothetical protein n=1 Tax=Streptomyces sp. NPDC056831 TaxID=3345954 RepID=UPI0036B70DE0